MNRDQRPVSPFFQKLGVDTRKIQLLQNRFDNPSPTFSHIEDQLRSLRAADQKYILRTLERNVQSIPPQHDLLESKLLRAEFNYLHPKLRVDDEKAGDLLASLPVNPRNPYKRSNSLILNYYDRTSETGKDVVLSGAYDKLQDVDYMSILYQHQTP